MYNSFDDITRYKEYERNNTTLAVNASLIEDKMHELFGLGNMIEPICYHMKYNNKSNMYAKFTCVGGGTTASRKQKVISAYEENNKLFIITSLSKENNSDVKTVTYEFIHDIQNNNYIFSKVTEK